MAEKSSQTNTPSTFLVQIMSCQNATWHGSVTWVEEQRSQVFRSTLELLKLIDSVVDGDNQVSLAIEGGSHEA